MTQQPFLSTTDTTGQPKGTTWFVGKSKAPHQSFHPTNQRRLGMEDKINDLIEDGLYEEALLQLDVFCMTIIVF